MLTVPTQRPRPQRASLAPGELVGGRYRVIAEVGAGSFGTVYRARHVHTTRAVALKVLHAAMAVDEATRARFAREVSAPAKIGHPGIVEVLDAEIDGDGQPFVAMEWLEGQTLGAWHAAEPRTLGALLDLFEQILEGLAAAHAAGFVHRDLKPENVFVLATPAGPVTRLLDFGLVRHDDAPSVTETGAALGTPRYMSPEQFMDAKAVGPGADVWAIGTMLYEATAGRPPFTETSRALVLAVLTATHTPLSQRAPDLPAAFTALVESCLKKEASERPKDASALLAGLRAARATVTATKAAEMPPGVSARAVSTRDERPAARGRSVMAPGAAARPRGPAPVVLAPRARRVPWGWIAAATVVILLATGAAGAVGLTLFNARRTQANIPAAPVPPAPLPSTRPLPEPRPTPPLPPMLPRAEEEQAEARDAVTEGARPEDTGEDTEAGSHGGRVPRARQDTEWEEDSEEPLPSADEPRRLSDSFERLDPFGLLGDGD